MRKVIERVLNLLAFLLTVRRPVTADEIRQTVAGYGGSSDEAFRRMFERDKELLRRLGIPLRMEATDAWSVEYGYVVPPEEYRMADPGLTDEERAALWLAARVVRVGGGPVVSSAVLKLGGARLGDEVEPIAADLGADAETLGALFQAVTERRIVEFDYRGRRRRVHPHGLGHRRGHWYLVGTEGGAPRTYRIDRTSGVVVGDEADAFEPDPEVNLERALRPQPWEAGAEPPVKARVRFDPEVAWWAARRLDDVTVSPGQPLEVELEVSNPDAFIGWVLTFGPRARLLSPPELVHRLVERVRGVA